LAFDLRARRNRDRDRWGDRLPPGQKVVDDWPVLTYGGTPRIDPASWRLRVFGAVDREVEFGRDELRALPSSTVHCDIHCVTAWSKMNNDFEGVLFSELLNHFQPLPSAAQVMAHCYGGYTTNVPLSDLMREGVLLAYRHNGAELAPDHGGPLRLVVPHLYFWKSAKWLRGLEFQETEGPGFWENYGYHIRGDPWKEERYS
jgi:DMSO/TMAO reductase YedYZ molybdopterin-dependent catalytic subunit